MPKEINWMFFGFGALFSIIYMTIFFNRSVFHPPLPVQLLPTYFILMAPPAIGFVSYIKISESADTFAYILCDPNVLVGFDHSADGGVYKLTDDLALVQTVDFFTPIVDDPYMFGQIAAANALSDVYAMGGTPKTVLNIVAYPIKKLGPEILAKILQGSSDKVKEAGAEIIGGHSIDDQEPKFGLSVTGVVHPDKFFKNIGEKLGDALILTKPLGLGFTRRH